MNSDLLKILACPECGAQLYKTAQGLLCQYCDKEYPIRDGIPRFVGSDNYVRSYSEEWQRHPKTQLDSVSGLDNSARTFKERTGLTAIDLKGKLVLDAGCGMGRYSEIAANLGAHVIGLDMSYAVDDAKKNVPSMEVVQADLMKAPFKPGTFDVAFSLGVLVATPDAAAAFAKLASLVKPGGKLSVWVYSNDGLRQKLYNRVTDLYRLVMTRLPFSVAYQISKASIPLYHVHKIPVIGRVTQTFIPTSMEPHADWRVLDTFDWYCSHYLSKHGYKEVEGWYAREGFKNVRRLDFPTSVQGVKA